MAHLGEELQAFITLGDEELRFVFREPTPKEENLRLAERAPQSGQAGLFWSEALLNRISKTCLHFPHSNSYIGIFRPGYGNNFNGSADRPA